MAHPCEGHNCDHCYVCDVVGICCGTISSQTRAQLEAAVEQGGQGDELRAAIVAEAGTVSSLGELMRRETATGPEPAAALMLPPAAPLGLPQATGHIAHNDSRKEPVYVYVQPACQAR